MQNINTHELPSSAYRGGRISTPKLRGAHQYARDFEGLEDDCNRFDLLKLVKRGGRLIGFTPRMTELLEYYLLFTRDCDWQSGHRPIVFQSLSKTALDLGVSERQIQKLESMLANIGAITWNDSGNHRRYGVRDTQTQEILYAFGVDLTPLASLRVLLQDKLQEKKLSDEAWMEAKRRISWYRSQIRAVIAEISDNNETEHLSAGFMQTYEAISYSIRTYMSVSDLDVLLEQHHKLYDDVSLCIQHVSDAVLSNQLHVNHTSLDEQKVVRKYSTKQPKSDKSDTRSSQNRASKKAVAEIEEPESVDIDQVDISVSEEIGKVTWKQVLNASSERFKAHFPMTDRPLNWSDIVDAAYALLPELGISRAAWWNACSVLGRNGAAICIMIIDQKAQADEGRVRNPGGYLREMTARAERGDLNLQRSIFGLLRREVNDDA